MGLDGSDAHEQLPGRFAWSCARPLRSGPARRSLAVSAAAAVTTWRRRGSGRDSGAQTLDAIAERGVFDLGNEDRRRVEGAPITEG
jgi:hypothetical protein